MPHDPAAIAFSLYGASLAIPAIIAQVLEPMHKHS